MKRAKYIGPHPEVEVWPDGIAGPSITVANGHLLPTEDAAGEPIPAAFRDSLLDQEDNWTEVKQSKPKPKPAAGEKED